MKKIKIRKEMKDKLRDLYHAGINTKRGEIKDKFNHSPLIHSRKTYETYLQQAEQFADFCMKNNYKYHDEHLPEKVQEYIDYLKAQGRSAWTCSTALSAISKAFEMRMKDFAVELPKRERGQIKRSRLNVERDRHINPEHYKPIYTFERCFGLRHHKELDSIQASDFEEKDGKLICNVREGKGGRGREVEFFGSKEELTLVRRYLENHQEGLLFRKGDIPSGMDCHALRGEYCARVYHALARDIKDVPPKEQYVCRKEKAGEVYDKKALEICSKMLGHNRTCVVVDNYSYRF